MIETPTGDRRAVRMLAALCGLGLAVRAAGALAVDWWSARRGTLCLFPDADIYWGLGRAIRLGEPFVVPLEHPHYALRTPGYPLFLAACQAMFGPSPLAARLAQAVLGTTCVLLVYMLVRQVDPRRDVRTALVAAALAAVEPYTAATSAVLLSEALFLPLLLLSLLGLAVLWDGDGPRLRSLAALGTGAAAGSAILAKPSWALFSPAILVAWVLVGPARGKALRGAALVMLGLAVTMAPWWVRNARIYGRFVPTALWAGASLYDGLSPTATGASDMRFMDDPEIRNLDESTQDALLMRRALDYARTHPGGAMRLAAIKAARFWSPWPNEASFRSPVVMVASAVLTVPLAILAAIGLWECRRDARALVILAGPLVYAAALHMVFVSSVRYRIPPAVPALGLAAIGLRRTWKIIGMRRIRARTA